MNPGDVFGQALLDHLEGKPGMVSVERDDGYVDFDETDYYFQEYADFPECERKALEHVKGRLLDIGVGAGRIALAFQGRGFDVLGIDISDKVLEVCRRRGLRSLRMMSACELDLDKGSFDTAVLFGNNFGICGAPDRVEAMLTKLRRILSREGRILAESIDPLKTTRKAHLKYHKSNLSRGRLPGHVTLRLSYGGLVGEWFDLLLATPAEMSDISRRAGWRIEKLYPSREPNPLYTAVLRKAEV